MEHQYAFDSKGLGVNARQIIYKQGEGYYCHAIVVQKNIN
jgi:hypothetical protein